MLILLNKRLFSFECGKAYMQLQTTAIHVCLNAGEIELHSRGLLARKLELLNFVRSEARFPPLSLILSSPLGRGGVARKAAANRPCLSSFESSLFLEFHGSHHVPL